MRIILPKTTKSTVFSIFFVITLFALGIALILEYAFGYRPCELCIYGRYPYAAVIFLSAVGVSFHHYSSLEKIIMCFIVLLFASSAILAFYHVGVEQKWWIYDGQCHFSTRGSSPLTIEQILKAPPVRCDQATFSLFGLSLAAYSFLLSLFLMLAALYSFIQFFIRNRK